MIDRREPSREEISAEDIMARMPPDMVDPDKALCLLTDVILSPTSS
jgi:hypothetical protein